MLHFVEAVLGRIGFGLIAHMPFAGKVRRIAVLLEELGNCRRLLPQEVLIIRGHHDRQRRADRIAPGDERGASRRAACLTVPVGEDRPLLGDLIDVWRRVTEAGTAARIGAEIVPAGIVRHQHDDIRPLLLWLHRGRCWRWGRSLRLARERRRGCDDQHDSCAAEQLIYEFVSHCVPLLVIVRLLRHPRASGGPGQPLEPYWPWLPSPDGRPWRAVPGIAGRRCTTPASSRHRR